METKAVIGASLPTQSKQILIVDGDPVARTLLSLQLQQAGYTTCAAVDPAEALTLLQNASIPDLILLDPLLCSADELAVIQELRGLVDAPLIVMASSSYLLERGDDFAPLVEDYLIKPVTAVEVLVRVRRALLRTPAKVVYLRPELKIAEDLQVSFSSRYAVLNEAQIPLTPTETRILQALYDNRGRIVSNDVLLECVWDGSKEAAVESLRVHVRRLRSKIEPEPKHPRFVVTVRKRGYYMPAGVSYMHD